MPDDLAEFLTTWPDPHLAAIKVVDRQAVLGAAGGTGRVSGIASISKILVGLSALVAIEEGTIALDDPAGPPGATVRHLLSHAAGLAFDHGGSVAEVGARRIYSNAGIELFADHLAARAGMAFVDYQHEAVIDPLGMTTTELRGSPAQSVFSSVDDLVLLARELLNPTIVDASTLALALTPQFPRLRGVVPGLGSYDPNPWGLGIELRGNKAPHWTAPGNTPATFGHFGGTGTFLWVDPPRGLACVAISGTEFGPWALETWPVTSQAILNRYQRGSSE